MFPGFDVLPEVLRPVDPFQPPNAPRCPATGPSLGRLRCLRPATARHTYAAAALREVREIELTGQEALHLIGLHEPDSDGRRCRVAPVSR